MKLKYNKISYYKLVRDKIPQILKERDIVFSFRKVKDKKEYGWRLRKKLQEEIEEFEKNPCAEELADIMEVITSLRKLHKIGLDELRQVMVDKKNKKGGFDLGIVLEWTKENK